MSILSRYRRTEDAIAAAIGDEAAAARLRAQGIGVHKLTPTTLSASNPSRGGRNPSTMLAGNRLINAGLDVGRHEDQFKHFAGHPYSIVRTIANRIAGQPLHHARRVKAGDEKRYRSWRKCAKEFLPMHLKSQAPDLREYGTSPIVEAFRNPNPLMVQFTLVVNTISCLEVTGKGYWWMRHEDEDDDGDGVGNEPQLWYIPPQWVEPVHTNERLFDHWQVRPNGAGEPFKIPGNEMVYFYYADLSNPLEAYAPFDALAQPIMAHESINESKRRSFLNSVSPAVAITIGQPPEASGVGAVMPTPVLTRPQRKALRSILLEEYRGTLANGLPLILDGFVKDIKRVYDSPRELDFLNSGAATTQDLNMGFGMNGISMGQVEGANRASSATADDHFCFPAGTLIHTSSGLAPIETVKAGDRVLTATGRMRPVRAVAARVHSGTMARVKLTGRNEPVVCTADHPFMVDGKEVAASALLPGWSLIDLPPAYGIEDVINIGHELASRGDTVDVQAEPTGQTVRWASRGNKSRVASHLKVTKEHAWMLGLFLAEGHICPNNGIVFSLHRGESVEVDLFGKIERCWGTKPKISSHPTNQAEQVYTRNATLARVLLHLFGSGARVKRVPENVYHWPRQLQAAFLAGYIAGDGHRHKDHYGFVTVSPGVAYGIQYLARMLGSDCRVYRYDQSIDSTVQGRAVKRSPETYHGRVYGPTQFIYELLSMGHYADVASRCPQRMKVESVAIEPVTDEWVYNLEIDADRPADQTYTLAGGIAVHNCRNVINPRLMLLSQVATRTMPRYFVKGGGRDDVVYWEPATSTDVEFDLKRQESMFDRGVINRDEWRGAWGMGAIENGTKVLVDVAGAWVDVVPVDPNAAKDAPPVRDREGNDGEGGPHDPDPKPRPMNTLKLIRGSLAERIGFKGVGEAHDRVHRLYEERIKADALELLRGLAGEYRQRVGAAVAQAGPRFVRLHAEAALDFHHWEYTLRAGLTPVLTEAAIAGAAHEWILAQSAALATKSFIPEGLRRRVGAAVEKIINGGLFRRIVEAVLNRIRRAVDKAEKTGESLPAAAVDAIATEEAVQERAAEIGQMEGQTAVGTGQNETYATLKIMHKAGGRKWLSMRDSRVRPTHDMADGQIVRGNQKFTVGGYQCDYPGDHGLPPEERINCRCVAVVVE